MKKSIKIKKTCNYCGKIFFVIPCHSDAKFCSHDCYSNNIRGEKRQPCSNETKNKIGIKNGGKNNGMYGGKPWNKRTKGVMKAWNKGRGVFKNCVYCGKEMWVHNYKIKTKKACSKKCEGLSRRGKKRPEISGKNNSRWAGGSNIKVMIRKSLEYKEWRLKIFERDKFICQMPECDKTVRILNAHHIIQLTTILKKNNIKIMEEFITCKELWNLDNGITLCEKCHHSIRKKEDEYINLFSEIVKLN